MSDLNPLAFKVAIQDEATNQLNSIEQAFDKLKDKTITVEVKGLSDLQQLLSVLQHQQVQEVGKNVGSAINEATKNLQKEAQDAVRKSLGELAANLVAVKEAIQHDNFTAFSKRIDACATSMNTLNEAFGKFKITIGSDEGMKNFMTGLGEVIRNVRNTIGMLNGSSTASVTPDAMSRSVKVARHETERLNNDLVRAQRTIETFGDKGFNVSALERYKKEVLIIRENLEAIRKSGGVHPLTGLTAMQYLSSEDASRVVTLLRTELHYYQSIGKEIEKISNLRSLLNSALTANPNTSYRGDINNAIVGLDLREGLLGRQGARDAMQTLNSEAYNQQIKDAVSLISKVSAESRLSARDNAHLIESMRRAGIAVSDLASKFDRLEIAKIRANAVDARVDTSAYDKAVERMERYRRVLEYIAKNGGHDADRITKSVGYRNASNDLNVQATALKALTKETNSASSATQQLSAEQQRLAQALETSTNKLHGQSQVLSDLKSLATQYLGVWGGQQFLNNIIQIGGQLEMQRLSIGAILQNQAQANDLFNKIKGLATQSPFGVVELDQMTKQLTAYGFKYNELFDMTKRLADISAATGTGVDRLALALGHVRSEAALSGYTLRQFAMGNVPMLQKLSEKLGKTTEEIRKMVRAKQITYDDVVGVLKDLTDEGGMFHNMQDVISQSVKAKFKNVRDAMDIMYGEMAEGSVGDALKEVADVLMDVTRNWKDAATVLGTGTAMWALHRVAVVANIAVLGEHNAATLKNIAAFRAQEVQQLRTASMYRVLSAAEQQQIAISKQLTASERLRIALGQSLSASRMRNLALGRQQQVMDLALALSSKELTTEDIARQVALGKLSKAQARQILNLADLTAAERIAGIEAVNNTRRYGFFRMALLTTGDAALKLGRALKAMVFNPATLMMAGVTAVMELWMRNSRELEAAEELSNKIYEHSQEALKNTRQMMQDTGIKVEWRRNNEDDFSDVTGNFGGQLGGQYVIKTPQFDTSEAEGSIERWSQYIREYAATPNRILNQALFDTEGNVRSLKEQFDNLSHAVADIVFAQEELKNIGGAFENAGNATNGGWFDDSVLTNISDYDKTLRSFGNNIATTYKKFRVNIDIALQSARQQDAEFDKAASGMATYAQQLDLLVRNQEKYAIAAETFRNANSVSRAAMNELSGDHVLGDAGLANVEAQRATMMEDLETFYIQLQADLETKGIKIGSMSEAQQQALLLGYKDKLSSIQGLSEETSNFLMKEFAKRFGIEIDVNDEKFRVKESEIKRLLKELSESDWNVEMNFATNIKDVIDEARKQYKAAKEYFEKVKPIMLKLGVEFEMGKELTQEQIDAAVAKADPQARDFVRQALQGVNEATRVYNQAMTASKHGGFSLEDEKKKSKGSGQKAYKDEFAKRWDERIRIMKEAYSWYDKWEKKVGNDAAIAETNSKYEDIFKEWRTDKVLPMDFDVKQIADYQKYVEKIRDDALARYQKQKNDKSKKNGEEALRVYRQAVALLNDIKFDNFIKVGEKFKSIIDQTIDDLNTRWEVFKTVRDATGDEEMAMSVAGISGNERQSRNSADAMKAEVEKQFKALGGMAPLLDIDFDPNLDEEKVREMFERLVPADAMEKIDGMIHAYKEWQKLQKQVIKEDINVFAKLIGSVVDYGSQLKKINDEEDKQKKSIQEDLNANRITPEQAQKATNVAETNANTERMKLHSRYLNLMNDSLGMTRKEVAAAATAIENNLNERLRTGTITAKEYADEMRKLHDITQKFEEGSFFGSHTAFTEFMKGGLKGSQNFVGERIQALQTKQNTDGLNDDETAELGRLTKLQGKLDGAVSGLSSFSTVLQIVTGVLDGFQKAARSLSEMFEALGKHGTANTWSDIADGIGAASSVFSPISNVVQNAMSGNVGGVISSAISAPIDMIAGPIIGFSKLHDKRRQREIEALQRNVAALEANTEVIRSLRGRTFGFDTGNLRRYFASQYKGGDAASNAMRNFYKSGTGATGYAQELANLEKERQDYINMYNEEDDKKNSSDEALLEYKKKIAELDEQIHYFSEDLAKELWDIDIKGWADQLSDGLSTAFENGESAAKAYKDTVTHILQQVMNKMMQMAILEPMFANLEEKLFGSVEKGTKGVFNAKDPKSSMAAVTSTITNFFGKGGEGEQTITAALEFMNAFERGLNNAGLSVLNDSANTLSSSVQGTSEETSGLLAGYVNSLRQDVAINRILLNQFVTDLWPTYVEQITAIVSGVGSINQNVSFIRTLLSENGAIYTMLDSMRNHLDNITNGNEQISVK